MSNQNSNELSEKDRKFREFALNGNLWQVIFYVCTPLAAFQVFQHMFTILDTIMASYVSPISVSAVAYLSQIVNMVSAVGAGLAVGSTLKISEAYGAGDYALVKKRVSTLLTICAGFALVVLMAIPFSPVILRVLGTTDDFIEVGATYFSVQLLSTMLSFFNNVYIAIERSRGNSKRILRLNMIVILVKLSLTAFFVYILKSNITMIAVASVLSNCVMLTLGVSNLLRGNNAFTFNIKSISFKKTVVVPMLKLSYPVIIEKVAFAFGKTIINSMCKEYGSTTVGALGISNNINGLCTNIQNGFQDGGAAIISQNVGANQPERGIETFKKLLLINATIGLIMLVLLNLFIDPITYIFANSREGFSPEFQQIIKDVFRYEALGGCIPLGVNCAVMALLFGFGKTKLTLLCNFCRVFVFRIPVLWALQNFTSLGSESAGIVMGVSNTLTAIFSFTVAMFVVHNLKKHVNGDGSD